MLTLYGVARSRASRPLWLLAEIGQPFTHTPIIQAYRLPDPKAMDAPHHTDRAAGAERRVSANDPCTWAGSFDGCTGRTAGAAVHTGQGLNFPGGTLRPFLRAFTDRRSVFKNRRFP